MLTEFLREINGLYFKTFQAHDFSFLHQYILVLQLRLIVKADFWLMILVPMKAAGKSELSPELGR